MLPDFLPYSTNRKFRFPLNQDISNNDKIVTNEKTQQKKIVFHGKATNANIHRKILIYIDWVKNELTNATGLVNGWPTQYSLVYDINPEVNIQTEGYTFSDYKMTLQFHAISSLLMGEKIYGSKSLGLRELIQNSIDSCRIRQETEELVRQFGQDAYRPKIKVILDQENGQVTIKDNGTGMSLDIIKRHFLNIGVSYYNSDDFLLKDFNYKPIGNFGIGFLSCFMLSNNVKVMTRHYKSKSKYLIELEKGNEWTSLTESEDVVFDGTEVILDYQNFIEVFENNPLKVKEFLVQYFLTDGIDFELVSKTDREITKINNPIVLSTPPEKGLVKIDLQAYLKDIEGYALVKNRSNFIRDFGEIDFYGELYRYSDEDGLLAVTDPSILQVDYYLNGNEIKYLSIPLVDSDEEDDFLNGIKFTDGDVDEVIEKMKEELRWISVIVPKEYQGTLSDTKISSRDMIFDKLGFEELEELGHSESCETKAFVETITLFEGHKNDLYLPFDKTDRDYGYWYYKSGKRKELFMRSVLIKDFRFRLPISASVFDVNTVLLNINSRKFIPDISRNNVSVEEQEMINYMLGKAIHLGARDALSLETDEKATLESFIKTFYDKKTEHEK
jgi:molecular chaperone HtpG